MFCWQSISFLLWSLVNNVVFEQAKFQRAHSFYGKNVSKKKFSIKIPSTNSDRSTVNSYNDQINNLISGFEQSRLTRYDLYLVNDALGLSNSGHHDDSQDLNIDMDED